MLKLYRSATDDWQSIGAELPSEIIWIDLLTPSEEEKRFVERVLGIRVPTESSLGQIEASSRLISDHDRLYLSSPAVRLDAMGLVTGLAGDRIVAMTADAAVIENARGARLRHFRQITAPKCERAILWELT